MEFSVSTWGVPGSAGLPCGFWSRAGARRCQGNLAHCWRSLDNCMTLTVTSAAGVIPEINRGEGTTFTIRLPVNVYNVA
jgi:hypothetical protein